MRPEFLQSKNLLSVDGIAHGFFGRRGGVSKGLYASLNCGPGSGDDKVDVAANRARVETTLKNGCALVSLHQIHSPKAVTVDRPWQMGDGTQADAMATNIPGIALGILTADCAPVLLADTNARVIGAAHAGWKGALGGVLESVIHTMEALGAERRHIVATVGPTISQTNYEVGPEFRTRFISADESNARFFDTESAHAHCHFDLPAYVRRQLEDIGIASIDDLAVCTYADDANFFSFRRTTHRAEADYGRQVSAIVLDD